MRPSIGFPTRSPSAIHKLRTPPVQALKQLLRAHRRLGALRLDDGAAGAEQSAGSCVHCKMLDAHAISGELEMQLETHQNLGAQGLHGPALCCSSVRRLTGFIAEATRAG